MTTTVAPKTYSVTLSAGIEQVLQLDNGTRLPDGRRELQYGGGPIYVQPLGNGRIRVTGERAPMEHFARHCRAGVNYCGEPWYGRSAESALRKVRAALDAQG